MPVALGGLPAPVFGIRAQKEYYRFFFAGLVLFMGCLMPWGPEWEMAGWQTFKGGVFTIIALGIMWSSWVAISHGKFDLSTMRWLVLASLPLTVMIWHLVFIFDEPAVLDYIRLEQAKYAGGEYQADQHEAPSGVGERVPDRGEADVGEAGDDRVHGEADEADHDDVADAHPLELLEFRCVDTERLGELVAQRGDLQLGVLGLTPQGRSQRRRLEHGQHRRQLVVTERPAGGCDRPVGADHERRCDQ